MLLAANLNSLWFWQTNILIAVKKKWAEMIAGFALSHLNGDRSPYSQKSFADVPPLLLQRIKGKTRHQLLKKLFCSIFGLHSHRVLHDCHILNHLIKHTFLSCFFNAHFFKININPVRNWATSSSVYERNLKMAARVNEQEV